MIRFVLRLVAFLPTSVAYVFARLLAQLARHSKLASIVRTNLNIAYPDQDQKWQHEMLIDSLQHTFYNFFEVPNIWFSSKLMIKQKIISVSGKEIFDDLRARNQAVIVVCPHLGCWEIFGYWVNLCGDKMMVLYRPQRRSSFNNLMIERRKRFSNELAPTNRSGVKQLLLALKRGNIVGILPDQVPSANADSVMAPFFDKPAKTMTLLHKLIKKSQATPILVTAIREKNHGFHIHILRAEHLIGEDKEQTAVALNQSIESLIQIAPAQYQWSYKRYRHNGETKY